MNPANPAYPQSEDSRNAQNTLVDGLKRQAEAHSRLRRNEQRVAAAVACGAQSFPFVWQTQEDQDAELRVYYTQSSGTEILGAQLTQLDYRRPTVRERVRIEEAFESELQLMGDLWTDVANHVAERGNFES